MPTAPTGRRSPLTQGWRLCALAPDSVVDPADLDGAAPEWIDAVVPGTVASSLSAAGVWRLGDPLDVDGRDWWYRVSFAAPDAAGPSWLVFDGLATLCDVWLNGERILTWENMFRSPRVDVGDKLEAENDLALRFRSLDRALAERRPRPRWKTNLVAHQQLRWRRTTLLGRMPGWSPAVAPVGPWREVRLETGPVVPWDVRVQSRLEGNIGVATLRLRLGGQGPFDGATFRVGDRTAAATREGDLWRAEIRIPDPPLWWPHTHGDQPLLDCSYDVLRGRDRHSFDAGRVGFRAVAAADSGRFALRVNGEPIYCRGACWTASDFLSLDGSPESLARDLSLAKESGANMLRVGGTMFYQGDRFYRLCDELGLLVWQDFPFANMDYPVEDPAFAADIEAEAVEQLGRMASHPCVAVYCGNSEVEQQAAMLGMPSELWSNSWFAEKLPKLCAEHHPGTPYVRSSPSGGNLPFHVRDGVAHYYGVGAYRRSLGDLRKDDVAFAAECLGFANVPEPSTLAVLGDVPPVHHPLWKQRVPRDACAGWDFDDVRDHYLKNLYGVDPVDLRWTDPQRYLRLGRRVTGELMAAVFGEWRSTHGRNFGGLVWFFKDLWPGAGWGIVDSLGVPKACYYALKRAWAKRTVFLTDEGLDGLHVHVVNEADEAFRGHVELTLLRDGDVVAARAKAPCEVAGRSKRRLTADALLGGFRDVAYAYRFGPPQHDVAVATLLDNAGGFVAESYVFPLVRDPSALPPANVVARAEAVGDGAYDVTISGDRFIYGVCFDVDGYLPDDNDFHVSPQRPRTIRLRPTSGGRFAGYVEGLNQRGPTKIVVTG